jgi:RNA polymerase sigma-70 factor (ECF subfamily)
LPSSEPGPDKRYEINVMRDHVQQALQQLSDDYRAVVVLRYFEDMTYRDMAFVLRIPERTVKSRLYSARRILADLVHHKV